MSAKESRYPTTNSQRRTMEKAQNCFNFQINRQDFSRQKQKDFVDPCYSSE